MKREVKKSSVPKVLQISEDELLQLGVVARAHGIRGEIRIHLFNPESQTLWKVEEIILRKPYRREFELYSIRNIRRHNKGPLLSLREIPDRNEAELLRGAQLFVKKSWLPPLEEGEFYFFQVEGLPVFDSNTQREIGTVLRIESFPAQDMLVFRHSETRREVRVPIVPELVPEIDVDNKKVVVNLIPGLIENR